MFLRIFSILVIVLGFSCSNLQKKDRVNASEKAVNPTTTQTANNTTTSGNENNNWNNLPVWQYCLDNTCLEINNDKQENVSPTDFSKEETFARFPEQISPNYQTKKDFIFAYGVTYEKGISATMERAFIGNDFAIYLYDSITNTKKLLFNQQTFSDIDDALKPIAFINANEILLEELKLDDAFQHKGIWVYNLQEKTKRKLNINENYLTTPEISFDRKFLLYGVAANVSPDVLHGNPDAIYALDIETNTEKRLKEIVGVCYNISWKKKRLITSNTASSVRNSVNLSFPWEASINYCVTRDGNSPPPLPIGSSTTCSNLGPHNYIAWDFDTPNNQQDKILAAEDGVVTLANFAPGSSGYSPTGYGNWVIITHSNNYRTLYAHLSSVNVTVGQNVAKGCFIGYEGTTGSSSGDHLHFEYEFPGGTSGNTYTNFTECGCAPHRGYSYTSQNINGPCAVVPAPSNDNCPGLTLTVGTQCSPTVGTIEGAKTSFGANTCTGCNCLSNDDLDVYYNFVATDSIQKITLNNFSSDFDPVIELRSSCSFGSNITCYSPSSSTSPLSYTYTQFTPGQTYYIRVYERNATASPPSSKNFTICVTQNSPPSSIYENSISSIDIIQIENNKVVVENKSNEAELRVNIYSSNGNLVKTIRSKDKTTSFDMTLFSPGIYFINAQAGKYFLAKKIASL